MTTLPLPKRANKKTIQMEQRKVHQSNRSLQGKNVPGAGMHWKNGEIIKQPANKCFIELFH